MMKHNYLSAVLVLLFLSFSVSNLCAQGAEELTPVKFTVPGTGITGHKVSMEGSPERVFTADADGVTYHLPLGKEVWFEVTPAKGYYVTHWEQDGKQKAYSSYTEELAVKIYKGLTLTLEVVKEGAKYLVEFEQPEGYSLTCIDMSRPEEEDRTVKSGDSIPAANNIVFEVSTPSGSSQNVPVDHWEINGHTYTDAAGDPVTSPNISFKLLHDVKVKVLTSTDDALAEISERTPTIIYRTEAACIELCNVQGREWSLFDITGHLCAYGRVSTDRERIDTSGLSAGIYVVRAGKHICKLIIR